MMGHEKKSILRRCILLENNSYLHTFFTFYLCNILKKILNHFYTYNPTIDYLFTVLFMICNIFLILFNSRFSTYWTSPHIRYSVKVEVIIRVGGFGSRSYGDILRATDCAEVQLGGRGPRTPEAHP